MRLLPALLCLLCLTACHSVRTVYDENGNVVKENATGSESDLSEHFEKEFDDSFSEKKLNGIPTSTSDRVSPYQKKLDDARRETKEYATGSYTGASKRSSLRDTVADAAGKSFSGNKRYDTGGRVAYDTNLRPDFLNETHGISATQRAEADGAERRNASDRLSSMDGKTYATRTADVDRESADGYIESRRDKTPEPEVTNFRDYYRRSLHSTKALLGRDNAQSE